MKQHVIRHPETEGRYWSLYGWAPLAHALRFSIESDAEGFRTTHGLANAKVEGVTFDDNARPDSQTDYNPFSA